MLLEKLANGKNRIPIVGWLVGWIDGAA
jgi:hypothetical protein